MGKKMMRALGAMVLTISLAMGCIGSASAWEPQWNHDEDLSSYKLCDNFGDIKLRFAVTSVPAIIDWETNEYVKWIEEVTNVDLSFELIPYDGRAEKLGLLLASGDYPDVFLSVGMTNQMISRYGVDEQMFLPLNDLIDQYGTFTKQIFEQYPGSENVITQLDGKIYSLPVVNECYHATVPTKFWMNQTWLDNLGLKQPTTLDELYNVLVAFRDQDANGNGDPSDEIPLAGDYSDGWYTNPERFIMQFPAAAVRPGHCKTRCAPRGARGPRSAARSARRSGCWPASLQSGFLRPPLRAGAGQSAGPQCRASKRRARAGCFAPTGSASGFRHGFARQGYRFLPQNTAWFSAPLSRQRRISLSQLRM